MLFIHQYEPYTCMLFSLSERPLSLSLSLSNIFGFSYLVFSLPISRWSLLFNFISSACYTSFTFFFPCLFRSFLELHFVWPGPLQMVFTVSHYKKYNRAPAICLNHQSTLFVYPITFSHANFQLVFKLLFPVFLAVAVYCMNIIVIFFHKSAPPITLGHGEIAIFAFQEVKVLCGRHQIIRNHNGRVYHPFVLFFFSQKLISSSEKFSFALRSAFFFFLS